MATEIARQGATALIILLFGVAAGLVVYGAFSFKGVEVAEGGGRFVNMRLEVLWTAIAAAILLAIFIYTR
ncbi:MAG: hypothetical protein ACRDFS_04030 [Chloroflexota bacterium]